MAMVSVASSCGGALGAVSSSPPFFVVGRTEFAGCRPVRPSTALLRRPLQRNFQPERRERLTIAERKTRNRGTSASLRDAQELVQSGVVRPVPPPEVAGLLSEGGGGYVLLDIRPIWEREKAFVPGSYHVPLFVEDTSTGALTLLKKGIQQGQGGWWMGQKLTTRNKQFVEQVQAAVPPGQKLLVACGEGLRSLLALEELNDAGFEQLAWLAGGFNTVRDTDFPKVEGPTKLRFATVGGASEYVLKFALFLSGVSKLAKGNDSG